MKASDIFNENASDLNIGDPVIITGKVQFQGKTGDIVDFGKDKRFVIVNLYNYGKHSFNSSDVSYNDYAESGDEQERLSQFESKVTEAKSLQSKFEKHLAKHGYDVAEKSKYWEKKLKDIDAQIAAWDAEMERRKQGKEVKSAGVTEGFGSQYSEELAQAVYANNPDLDTSGTADELVGAGFEIAADELGRKKARNLFAYDEDFASDFVSAYAWLKQGGSQHVGEGDELNVGIEAYGVRGANSKKWRKKFKSQEVFEKWLDANEGDVEVLGTREVNLNDMFEDSEGQSSEAALLMKLAKVVKSVQTPEQYTAAKKYARMMWNKLKMPYYGSFVPKHMRAINDLFNSIESDLRAKRRELGIKAPHKDDFEMEDYDPSYDPDYRPYEKPEQDPDAWKQQRDLEEPAASTSTVTVRDGEGNVVLQFPSTGGYYGDVRTAKAKGFDTESGDYDIKWQKNEDSIMAEDSGATSEQVASEIVRRIIFKHKDAITQFGPEAIMAAAREVGEYFAGWEELGTSDIGVATKYTLEKLDQMSRGALGESASAGGTSAGSIATTPAGGAGKNVGSLFGGTYKQKRTKKSPGTK